jgi:protein-tyrosine phosphatase
MRRARGSERRSGVTGGDDRGRPTAALGTDDTGQTARIDIVFVCTANINRSPMAAALFARHVALVTPPLPPGSVRIGSAGLLEGGRPSSAHAVATLAARGIDLRGHRSCTLAVERVRAADLVLTMERAHLRAAAVLVPGAFTKTFTLRELVRRGLDHARSTGARPGPALAGSAPGSGAAPDPGALSAWLDALNVGR